VGVGVPGTWYDVVGVPVRPPKNAAEIVGVPGTHAGLDGTVKSLCPPTTEKDGFNRFIGAFGFCR
jgi:hypothetical protein